MVRKIPDKSKMTAGGGARRKVSAKPTTAPAGAAPNAVAVAVEPAPIEAVAPSPRAQIASKSVEAVEPKRPTVKPVGAEPAIVEPRIVKPAVLKAIGKAEAAMPPLKGATAPQPKTTKEPPPSAGPAVMLAPAAPASEKKEPNIMATATTIPPKPQAAAEKVNSMISDLNLRAKAMFEKTTKAGEELTEFTKGNMEAFATSAKTAAKGAESLGQEIVDYSKKRFESASETIKNLATVKTPTELFQIQSDYAKSSFDSAVAEASKLSEAWLKLAGDVIQPLSSRYALAADKIKSATL